MLCTKNSKKHDQSPTTTCSHVTTYGPNAQTGNDAQSQQMFKDTTDIVFHLGALSNAGIAQAILNQLTDAQRDKLNKGVGIQVTCFKTATDLNLVDAGYDAGNDQAALDLK